MDKDIRYISFSSPKGGVGRTLTLSNCARIYADGSGWGGIEPSITLLADLDFNAPGLHYYDFSRIGSDRQSFYRMGRKKLSRDQLLKELQSEKKGLLFLLSAVIREPDYLEAVAAVGSALAEDRPEAEVYDEFNETILDILRREAYDPLQHLVEVENGSRTIFLFPAASTNHPEFNKHVFRFDWLDFDSGLGVLLLDCIFYLTTEHIRTKKGKAQPVRILIDQQAGVSIPSALNRSLADASIFVSGMNWQNKAGLLNVVRNYITTYEKNPWVVLNQYDFRHVALDYSFQTGPRTPHEKFRALDKEERQQFVEDLTENNAALRDQIYVTEFNHAAVQREHFYEDDELAMSELTRMLVSIERSFEPPAAIPAPRRAPEKIVFIGERVRPEAEYGGPLRGIYTLLEKHFPPSTRIIVIAAKHEEIVALLRTGKLEGRVGKRDAGAGKAIKFVKGAVDSLESGIYDFEAGPGNILDLTEIDLVSWPYYLKGDLAGSDRIVRFQEKDFIRQRPTPDSLSGTSAAYYRQNILRWEEYGVDEHNLVMGIPLFIDFELMVYRKNFLFDQDHFMRRYRKCFHRDFDGLNAPQDLLNFAGLTKEDSKKDNNVLLCGNPRNIAMWYEWQSIFSMFYDLAGKPRQCTSIEAYLEFLISEDSISATLQYLELLRSGDLTRQDKRNNDWDQLTREFFVESKGGLMFVWPDALPVNRGVDESGNDDLIYQALPSFHYFEECWQLSIVNKRDKAHGDLEPLLEFLNDCLTVTAQEVYMHNGGLPVHKRVLSSLDTWYEYPFIPPIWMVYSGKNANEVLTKRDSFEKNFEAGKAIAQVLRTAYDKNIRDKDELRLLISESLKEIVHGKAHAIHS